MCTHKVGVCLCIVALRRINKQIPAALVMLLLTTLITYVTGASENSDQESGFRGIFVLKELKTSLPQPKYETTLHGDTVLTAARRLPSQLDGYSGSAFPVPLIGQAALLALLAFMESISVAKKFAGTGRTVHHSRCAVRSPMAQVRTTTTSTPTKSWWRWACPILSAHSSTPSPRAPRSRALRSTTRSARARLCATHSPLCFVVRLSDPLYARSHQHSQHSLSSSSLVCCTILPTPALVPSSSQPRCIVRSPLYIHSPPTIINNQSK